jgi:microcystin-dependent protein
MFAGNFAPRGWSFCDGQLLAVSQNDALFSLLGTIYGGDGRTTFGLPDLRGRLPIHAGDGPGLSPRRLGAKAGAEDVTLTVNQLPSHSHRLKAVSSAATTSNPSSTVTLAQSAGYDLYVPDSGRTNMANSSITSIGGSRSHTNLMPYLCVHFIIALFGIYPSRQ